MKWSLLKRNEKSSKQLKLNKATVLRSTLRVVDLFAETARGLSARPGRTLLTALGAVVGVGAFTSVIALTSITRAQVNAQFNKLDATQVIVSDTQPSDGMPFSTNTESLVDRLHGVISSGVVFQVSMPINPGVTRLNPVQFPTAPNSVQVSGASPGLFASTGAQLMAGSTFNTFANDHKSRVAVLGSGAANILGITSSDIGTSIFLAGVPFEVVGIAGGFVGQPYLLTDVIIPQQTALEFWGPPSAAANLVIATRIGSAGVVQKEVPYAVLPDDPSRLLSVTSTGSIPLQSAVNGELSTLLVLVGAVALLLGGIGIASATMASVLERFFEIGLRRSLGATRRHIWSQFLTESILVGTLGGVIGTCVAVIVVSEVSLAENWVAVLNIGSILPDPLIGTVAGFLAGIYPSLRAAFLDPVEALRR